MSDFLRDLRETLLPEPGSRHGPLPPMLVALTLVTGLVDAFSYLVLGHVFVANMTGNVVFVGFALVGAPGFSLAASLTAIASFVVGALLGGRIGRRFGAHRGLLLSRATTVQTVLIGVSILLAAIGEAPIAGGYRYGLIAALAVAMGLQNAAVRQLAVPDLTTTVLTMTMTGIAADGQFAGGSGSKFGRRLVAILAMLVGALVGASLALHVRIVVPLLIAFATLVVVAVVALVQGRSNPDWVRG